MDVVDKQTLVRWFNPAEADLYVGRHMPNPRFLEIDAGDRLYVELGPNVRPERFATFFREAWLHVPPECRRPLAEHWARGFPGSPWLPQIDYSANYHLVGGYDVLAKGFGFNALVADLMPDPILWNLIGHEVAHAWHSLDKDSEVNKIPGDYRAKEAEADATANAWRFDMTALREWGNANLDAIRACGIRIAPGEMF